MTIHSDHPFLPAEGDRDPVRRFRGRLATPVTLWTAGQGAGRAGLTVGTTTFADGDPALVLGLLDPESELLTAAVATDAFAVIALQWSDRNLADVLAGLAPGPGGALRGSGWTDTAWGAVPDGRSWVGCRLVDRRTIGYAEQLVGAVEHVELAADGQAGDRAALARLRGRYVAVPGARP